MEKLEKTADAHPFSLNSKRERGKAQNPQIVNKKVSIQKNYVCIRIIWLVYIVGPFRLLCKADEVITRVKIFGFS